MFSLCYFSKYKVELFPNRALDEIIPMQFTGLFDDEGKEIYEGDILKKQGHRKRVVEWTVDAFTLKQIPAQEGDNPYRMKDFIHGARIIGNVYENPELLK